MKYNRDLIGEVIVAEVGERYGYWVVREFVPPNKVMLEEKASADDPRTGAFVLVLRNQVH